MDGKYFATIVNSVNHGYEVIWADRSHYYAAKSLEDAKREVRRKAGVALDDTRPGCQSRP